MDFVATKINLNINKSINLCMVYDFAITLRFATPKSFPGGKPSDSHLYIGHNVYSLMMAQITHLFISNCVYTCENQHTTIIQYTYTHTPPPTYTVHHTSQCVSLPSSKHRMCIFLRQHTSYFK